MIYQKGWVPMPDMEMKNKLVNLIKTARGQMDAILAMVEEEKHCTDILTQLSAAQGLLKKSTVLVLENQIKNCLQDAVKNAEDRENKIDEIVSILAKLTKS